MSVPISTEPATRGDGRAGPPRTTACPSPGFLAIVDRLGGVEWCLPRLMRGGSGPVALHGVVDLALALKPRDEAPGPVPKDLALGGDVRMVFITGPIQAARRRWPVRSASWPPGAGGSAAGDEPRHGHLRPGVRRRLRWTAAQSGPFRERMSR